MSATRRGNVVVLADFIENQCRIAAARDLLAGVRGQRLSRFNVESIPWWLVVIVHASFALDILRHEKPNHASSVVLCESS